MGRRNLLFVWDLGRILQYGALDERHRFDDFDHAFLVRWFHLVRQEEAGLNFHSMSKNNRSPDASKVTSNPTSGTTPYVSIAFCLGMTCFVVEGFWYLLHGPFGEASQHRIHAIAFYGGLMLAAVSWLISQQGASWLKVVMMFSAFGGCLLSGIESIRQFELAARELMRGTIQNGRVVYPGLGLSFVVPANWQMNLRPFIKTAKSTNLEPKPRQRALYGETVVFFQATPPVTVGTESMSFADSIQLEGKPFLFRSIGRSLGSVRKMEASYRGMAGVKIVQPTRYYQLSDLELADFELFDEGQKVLYRHVIARSGDFWLDFVLTATGEDARPRFEEFVSSIRINGRQTCFNE